MKLDINSIKDFLRQERYTAKDIEQAGLADKSDIERAVAELEREKTATVPKLEPKTSTEVSAVAPQLPAPQEPSEGQAEATDWQTPAHEEINLETVNPEDLGLDPWDFDNPLVKKIYAAQKPTETVETIEGITESQTETDSAIRTTEIYNKELLEAVEDEGIEVILPTIPETASSEEKLQLLQRTGQILADSLNQVDEQQQREADAVKPKYGHGLVVNIDVIVDGERKTVWVDETGTDVDTGAKYDSPEIQNVLKKKLDERRKEKAAEVIKEYDRPKEAHIRYAMTIEDYDDEIAKDFPVLILPKKPGPMWDDSILYGAAGELIRKASQFSESHPAGMLVDFLVSIGNIIGRGPYFNISATRHYTNEFMARVGDSSTSRKGTGRNVINEVLRMVDPKWFADRTMTGFGSGEAIIDAVRDSVVQQKMNHRKNIFENIIVPGVDDKRLFIREDELASVFLLAAKPGSRADIVIRDGWDGNALKNTVKGKTNDGFTNSNKCDEPHISISGDTTIHELLQKMPPGAEENGFGNRFLYVYVYRVKDCPQGAPRLNWDKEILYFQTVVKAARSMTLISMSDQARKWWNRNYARFEHEGPQGLAGKMTARAAAHIRRIAMLYALIDLSDQIELEHFQAAEKLWRYCEDSAMFIFGGTTREQLRILKWIETRGSATWQEIRDELYSRNKKVTSIKADIDSLIAVNKLADIGGRYTLPQHGG